MNNVAAYTNENVRIAFRLAKAGQITTPSYLLVFIYYCLNTVANSTEDLREGYVLPNSILPKTVAAATGLHPTTVRRANTWLHEQGFIRINEVTSGKYKYIQSIQLMMCFQDEEERRKTAGKNRRISTGVRSPRYVPEWMMIEHGAQ